MANKVRCGSCRNYFDRDGMRKVGLGWVCATAECRPGSSFKQSSLNSKPKPSKPRKRPDDVPAETRSKVLDRDHRRCMRCGVSRSLQVHHIAYRSEGVDHQAHNLIVLCRECHAIVHSNKRYWQPILRGYIWMRYVEGGRVTVPMVERRVERWSE